MSDNNDQLVAEAQRIAAEVVQRVAELPDRTSPDDWPEAMLVTGDELQQIILSALQQAQAPEAFELRARPDVRIADRCPSCGHQTLFIANGGWLTCSWLECKNPAFSHAREQAQARPEIETPALVAYITADSPAKRDAAFLRTYAARVRDRSAASWETPNTVASTLEDIADRLDAAPLRERGESELLSELRQAVADWDDKRLEAGPPLIREESVWRVLRKLIALPAPPAPPAEGRAK